MPFSLLIFLFFGEVDTINLPVRIAVPTGTSEASARVWKSASRK
jgi:hypothetical protein